MTLERQEVLADRMRDYQSKSSRAKGKATCEYCGCEFYTSRIRIFYGPVVCFECRYQIFGLRATRTTNDDPAHWFKVNTVCRKKPRGIRHE